MKTGQMISFDVPVEGEPVPKVTWIQDGAEMRPGGRLKIDNPDYRTKLQLRNTERADSGIYIVRAVNENGRDEATVKIVVVGMPFNWLIYAVKYASILDKPTKPMGPLVTKDVYADHMTLDWKPPEDDGGLPIDHYVLEKMDTATGHWVPAGRSEGAKTTALVEGLTPGHEYKFRVSAVNAEGQSEPLETFDSTLAKNPYDKASKQ